MAAVARAAGGLMLRRLMVISALELMREGAFRP